MASDELHLWIFPVIAGRGQRLIEGIGTTHLELVDTTLLASGIVVNVYSSNQEPFWEVTNGN